MSALVTQPGDLISTRLLLLRDLAQSLETSQLALTRNDAEMIARGAAHQAELCRQWSLLEDQLRPPSGSTPLRTSDRAKQFPLDATPSAQVPATQIEQEFTALTVRIRHLTRVHCSLLRYLQRSLTILTNAVNSCSPTYTPTLSSPLIEARPQAGD